MRVLCKLLQLMMLNIINKSISRNGKVRKVDKYRNGTFKIIKRKRKKRESRGVKAINETGQISEKYKCSLSF